MLIVDAHLDLAYNALNNGRNLRLPVADTRTATAKHVPTVSVPDMLQGNVALCFGTLFVLPASSAGPDDKIIYQDAATAHRHALTQLDYYHRLADEDEHVRLVGDNESLGAILASLGDKDNTPLLGIVPLMEGADPIREPEEVEMWYERGLRLIGPAWDNTRYASGAWHSEGGLTKDGRFLLEIMAQFGFILDLTHMSEQATLEALDQYEGVVVATHSNCRALVPGERQFSDTQIRRLGERDGVIGVALYNPFLRAGHRKGEPKGRVTTDHIVAHIDHICQLLGDARHVGIGSDLDGGFGRADIPAEMDTIADLQLIGAHLRTRGYADSDIANILGLNWIHLLRRAWS